MRLTGTNGTLYLRQADGAWVLVGPCKEPEAADVAVGEMTCQPSRLAAGGVTITIKTYWNRLCAAFGAPKSFYHYPRQPLRQRRHGGGLPSKRDVRTRWQAVRYG